MRRSGKTAALLQKVNAQLRGERVPIAKSQADEDDGVGAYLSSLSVNKNAEKEIDWSKFADLSDQSEKESVDPKETVTTGSSKFLKKKPVTNETTTGKSTAVGVGPSKTSGKFASTSKSTALSKAAAFTSKYSKSKIPPSSFNMSDSDLDLDLSMDEDVVDDIKKTKSVTSVPPKSLKSDVWTKPVSSVNDVKTSSKYSINLSEDEDSIGRGGGKFLKKKVKPEEKVPYPQPTGQQSTKSSGKQKSMFRLASAEKYSTKVTLDSDEESLANYMHNLSPSSSTDLSAIKTPRAKSPPSARRQAFMKAKLSPKDVPPASPIPMENIKEEDYETSIRESAESVSSEEGGFQFNVMGLDDLEPAVPVSSKEKHKSSNHKERDKPRKDKNKEKKKTAKEDNIFSDMGLYTVDDLLGNVDDIRSNHSDISDTGEYIHTEPIDNDYESYTARSSQPLRSILSPSPRVPGTPKSTRSRVRLSLGDVREASSGSPSPEVISSARPVSTRQYSDDFEDVSETAASIKTEGAESEIETIATESRSGSPIRSRRSSAYSDRRKSDAYSDDFTSDGETRTERSRRWSERSTSRDSMTYSEDYTSYTDSLTSRSRTPSPVHHKKGRNVEIQTDANPGLMYHWNLDGPYATLRPSYGLDYVDPTPVATHRVSPDDLEALTSYSPSVLALNDMLRQQLQLTTQFIDSYKRMHQSYVRNLEPDYMYTTLEDTRNYIKKNKKPVLTFERALQQVKEEMGMES